MFTKKFTSVLLAAAIIACSLIIVPPVDAYSTDFSSSEGWTIIGNAFDITGGELVCTDSHQDESDIARYDSGAMDTFNVTFDFDYIEGNNFAYAMAGVYANALSDTNTNTINAGPYARFCFYNTGNLKGYYSNGGAHENKTEAVTVSLNTWYTCRILLSMSEGTYTANYTVFDRHAGGWDDTVLSWESEVNAPSKSFRYITFHNQAEVACTDTSFKVDNIRDGDTPMDDTPMDNCTISSHPLLTAPGGSSYSYDVATTGTDPSISFSMTTNATWLSIDSATGVISGTAPDLNATYYVEVTAANDTSTSAQNYTLTSYAEDLYASNIGLGQSIGNLYKMGYALKHNNSLYICYQGYDSGTDADVYIQRYNGTSQLWEDPVWVADGGTDWHYYPYMCIDNEGYFHLFYGSHNSAIHYSKSTNPYDISTWTAMSDIGSAATYQYPFVDTDSGDIYLFYRNTVSDPNHKDQEYVVSTDGGSSWSSPTKFIDWEDGDVPYMGGVYPEYEEGDVKMHFTWNENIGGTTFERHDIYYAYMDMTDNHLYSADGTDLGTSVTEAEAITHCQVLDTGDAETVDPRVVIDADGDPHIIYVGNTSDDDICSRYTAYNSTSGSWSSPVAIDPDDPYLEIRGSPEFFILDNGDIKAYLTPTVVDGYQGGDLNIWTRSAASGDWTCDGSVLSESQMPSGSYLAQPTRVFERYGGYTDWHDILFIENNYLSGIGAPFDEPTHLYVYGDNGFITNGTEYFIDSDDPAAPLQFTSTPSSDTIAIGESYSYDANVNKENATWSLSGPAWLSIDSATGIISGGAGEVGNHSISISATVGNETAWQNYTLTVRGLTPIEEAATSINSMLFWLLPFMIILTGVAVIMRSLKDDV